MNKTNLLLLFALPLVFIAGCIEGQAVISLNQNGSGKIDLEGLFDYAAYSKTANLLPSQSEGFFLAQINRMLANDNFAAWKDVQWKLLENKKYYFKGTAYFDNINQTDFYIGSVNSNLKISLAEANKPALELKYVPGEQPQQPALLQAVNINLIIILPGKIEKTENFELLTPQTAALSIRGYRLSATSGKITFTPTGEDSFDYHREVRRAKKESQKTIRTIETRLEEINAGQTPEKLLTEAFNLKMRQGLSAEAQKNFDDAMDIYSSVINDPNANEKFKAAANYQIGVCFLQTKQREKAEAQFEYVLNTFPSQRNAALKSVRMLKDMRFAKTVIKEEKTPPFVVDTFPALDSEYADPNLAKITLIFDQPMKKTDWLYSSFKKMALPEANGLPYFDPCGVEWTLPVKLQPGKVYAIAVNSGQRSAVSSQDSKLLTDNSKLNTQNSELFTQSSKLKTQNSKLSEAGFAGASGLQCEKFVLLFATLDEDGEPTMINDDIIEQCNKINYPQ